MLHVFFNYLVFPAYIPGLTGHSGDAYIRHAAVDAAKAGYRPVVFNHKGGENLPVTIP